MPDMTPEQDEKTRFELRQKRIRRDRLVNALALFVILATALTAAIVLYRLFVQLSNVVIVP